MFNTILHQLEKNITRKKRKKECGAQNNTYVSINNPLPFRQTILIKSYLFIY